MAALALHRGPEDPRSGVLAWPRPCSLLPTEASMTTITRSQFTDNLSARGGYIDVDRMTPDLRRAFLDHGIGEQELRNIAGQDHVIRGARDFERLFNRIDELDRNGSSSSIDTGRASSLTRSGEVYEAIRREVDVNRTRAASEGGRRFSGDRTLDSVAAGHTILREGARGEHVRKVQQALIDLGFMNPSGATGTYNRDTRIAVERFQREVGIGVDGAIGAETLGALAATSPPPGQQLERRAEYDRIYARRAPGHDHRARLRRARLGPGQRARDPVRPARARLPAARLARLPADRATAARPHRRSLRSERALLPPPVPRSADRPATSTPWSASSRPAPTAHRRAAASSKRCGRTRWSSTPATRATAPVRTSTTSTHGAGNFVIDPHGNRRADHSAGRSSRLDPRAQQRSRAHRARVPSISSSRSTPAAPKSICTTCETPSTFGRNHQNTDIITTTLPTRVGTSGQHALRFLQGVTGRESNNTHARRDERRRAGVPAPGQHARAGRPRRLYLYGERLPHQPR